MKVPQAGSLLPQTACFFPVKLLAFHLQPGVTWRFPTPPLPSEANTGSQKATSGHLEPVKVFLQMATWTLQK